MGQTFVPRGKTTCFQFQSCQPYMYSIPPEAALFSWDAHNGSPLTWVAFVLAAFINSETKVHFQGCCQLALVVEILLLDIVSLIDSQTHVLDGLPSRTCMQGYHKHLHHGPSPTSLCTLFRRLDLPQLLRIWIRIGVVH